VEVVASLSQGRTAAAQCGLFTHKSVPVIFEPPCISDLQNFSSSAYILYFSLLSFLKERKQTHTSTTLPVSFNLFNRVTEFHQTWHLRHYVTIKGTQNCTSWFPTIVNNRMAGAVTAVMAVTLASHHRQEPKIMYGNRYSKNIQPLLSYPFSVAVKQCEDGLKYF